MATAFDGMGLGMLGREGQFSRGGPVNDLVKLLPAFGAAYGLVKSGAVDKLNAGNWLSNPTKAMTNAITGSAPAPDSSSSAVAPTPVSDNTTVSPVAPVEAGNAGGDVEGSVAAPFQETITDPAITAPVKGPSPIDENLINDVIGDSSITPDKLTADRSQDTSVLQTAYMPNPSAVPPVGQGGGGGGGGGADMAKIFTTLLTAFA
jgi:hypothetical protein